MRLAICAAALLTLTVLAVGRADAAEPPHWIWLDEERVAGQQVRLARDFELESRAVDAALHLAVDFARCRVIVNGRTVADLDEYSPWSTFDVAEFLRAGANRVEFDCVAGAGPSALAASLHVDLPQGATFELASGSDWQASSGDRSLAAVSLGAVSPELWDLGATAKVSAFDDYEQWRQATGAEAGADPATFAVRPGFEVDLVRSATDEEGSWVSLAFDPDGRLTIAREDKGLRRLTLSEDGGKVDRVETIDDSLLEVRGLLYAHGALYANANNSLALYRLRDTNGDDRFDETKELRKFPGGVGHGRNDLALGPDGWIYSIHGDSVEIPRESVVDRTSPFREARRGQSTSEGSLLRTDANGEKWELIAAGMRNPFGVDFNADGEAFTYDADAEFDMGAPWYRPTRIDQLVSGADFGWRGRTGQWPPDFPDSADDSLPVVDVGHGSPTAVKSGATSSFPPRYRRAIFALDWAYGRILACHLSPRGAGYACRVEQFLKGRPLNVTDLDFGPDGHLYLITGGRKTQSALYRVRYVGPADSEAPPSLQAQSAAEFSAGARELRRSLESLHGPDTPDAVATAWPHLASADPLIRHAARVAIEHRPLDEWSDRALAEDDVETAASALLSVARSGDEALSERALRRANELPEGDLSTYGTLSLIQTYRLLLVDSDQADLETAKASRARLRDWLLSESSEGVGPLGAGGAVPSELARLASDCEIEGIVEALRSQLDAAEGQSELLHAQFVMRRSLGQASPETARRWFEALGELDRSVSSGEGMPDFLRRLREDAVAGLTDSQRQALGELTKPASPDVETSLATNRPLVRRWTLDELAERVEQSPGPGDAERGSAIFREAKCSACHRLRGQGGVIGPDLTSSSSRFSRRDLLASIVEPSLSVAEIYRGVQVVTTDGRVIAGRVVTSGDYRLSKLGIVENPLRPSDVTEIAKSDVETLKEFATSTMPTGLLDTFTVDEIADLLAALTASPEN